MTWWDPWRARWGTDSEPWTWPRTYVLASDWAPQEQRMLRDCGSVWATLEEVS